MGDSDRTKRRGRLDPDARARVLAQIAALSPARQAAPPPTDPGPSGLAGLRELILAAQEAGIAPPPPTSPPPSSGPAPSAPEPAPAPAPAPVPALQGPAAEANWARLDTVPVDADRLEDNLIITARRTDPAHGAFDVLRTRMVQAMAERGWRRVGITSPTKGCGKTFTALNLAVTLSRYGDRRTVLLDLDLRVPALARTLGVTAPGPIAQMLRGQVAPVDHLCRFGANRLQIGGNVALGLNDRAEPFAAELFHAPEMAAALARIDADLAPDLVLFDLPPALAQDDVIALAPHYDCILMVVGGGVTTPRQIREAIRRIGEEKPLLGMILNRAEGGAEAAYSYAYD
ncbi:MAG: CpsD/CapB family tyrosine-protein kinase [Rubellimicrobium sp.]|nr:CpsD/CapB family tyrosine-protein kinase [Rubellimicrobium sp.]